MGGRTTRRVKLPPGILHLYPPATCVLLKDNVGHHLTISTFSPTTFSKRKVFRLGKHSFLCFIIYRIILPAHYGHRKPITTFYNHSFINFLYFSLGYEYLYRLQVYSAVVVIL